MKALWGAVGALMIAGAALAAAPPSAPASAPARGQTSGQQSGPAGLNLDSSKPIQVNADTFAADLNQSTGTYRGNVVVVQGAIRLRADEVKVFAPDGKAQRMEAHGRVVIDSPSGTATGDNGSYDVVARVIRLTGDVRLTKDQNVMRGNALDVDITTGKARLVAVGTNGKPGRVQAVFNPPQSNKPQKPQPGATTAPAAPATPPSPAPNP
jgi:lipopolysaccharide export system protein LptA